MTKRVSADPFPRRNRAKFLSAFHRRLHPAPGSSGMRLYDSAPADVPVGQHVVQRPVQRKGREWVSSSAAILRFVVGERREPQHLGFADIPAHIMFPIGERHRDEL